MSSAWKFSHFGKPPKLKKVSANFLKSAFTETEQLGVKKDRLQKRYALVLVAILVAGIWQRISCQSPELLIKTVTLIHLTQEKFKWTAPFTPTSSVAFYFVLMILLSLFLDFFFVVHFLRGKAKICLPLKLLLEILHSMPSPGARLRLNTLLGCRECTSNVNILCLDISIYRYM